MLGNPPSKLMCRERTTALLMVLLAVIVALLMVGLLAPRAQADPSSFTVNTTGDQNDLDFPSGPFDGVCDVDGAADGEQCTLRAAIQEANSNGNPDDLDQIIFDIPAESDPGCDSGSGVCTISPAGSEPSPVITERVSIDGYTQGEAHPNTLAVGNDAVLNIELDGSNTEDLQGLLLDASNSVIRGLVINNFERAGFDGAAIYIRLAAENNKIEGNFIGTDPSGTQAEANQTGVVIDGGNNNTIGGTTPEARNLISGNDGDGVSLFSGADHNKVLGNYIGTKKGGTNFLGNRLDGMSIFDSSDNTIGGTPAAGGANTIAFNRDNGVDMEAFSIGNRILINSIHSNRGLGIDLEDDGRTPNDAKDLDLDGANTLQNKPTLTSATTTGTRLTIEGRLSSTPDSNFAIRFFSNREFEREGPQGRTYLGQMVVSTDATGKVSFSKVVAKEIEAGQQITATATGPGGNTSEISFPQKAVQQ